MVSFLQIWSPWKRHIKYTHNSPITIDKFVCLETQDRFSPFCRLVTVKKSLSLDVALRCWTIAFTFSSLLCETASFKNGQIRFLNIFDVNQTEITNCNPSRQGLLAVDTLHRGRHKRLVITDNGSWNKLSLSNANYSNQQLEKVQFLSIWTSFSIY